MIQTFGKAYWIALAVVVAIIGPPSARAGGCNYRNGVDARSRGAGGAGVAWAQDALSGLAENPAALALAEEPSLALNISSAFTAGELANSANTAGSLKKGPFFVPETAYAHPVGDSGWTIGAGISPEMMLAADWEYVDAVGAAGASYGLQRHNSEFLLLRMAGGAAYRVSDRFALGGSVGVVYNRNSLQVPYIFQEQPALRGLKTLLDLGTTGYAPDACMGAVFDWTENVHIAGVYKTGLSFESRGRATGDIGAQFERLGVDALSTFAYDAEVHTSAPRVATVGLAWEPLSHLSFAFQGEWHGWHSAMPDLPIFLTNGTNETINGLLGSTSLNDRAPFHWKDRYVGRVGGEVGVSRHWALRAGYAHSNAVVPGSTLSPLTADITENTLTWGVGYGGSRGRVDLAYQWDLPKDRFVAESALAGGEYTGSRVDVALHWLTLSTTLYF